MYAIIRIGGKQAKVSPGDIIDVERIKDAGDVVSFVPLLVVDESGTTITDREKLAKVAVSAKVLGESRGPKVDVFKYKNKTGYRRRSGHRQTYTTVQVKKITLSGGGKKTAKKAATKESPADDAVAEEA